ncbi:alpha galactosidase A [Streptohalobacillus salinus]|uniref:Alpha-galactosidase n=1 Tax=Streptohalobacillus salinus TaxID=621096 RepID=A0A2V3WD69_9BACI|nr:glycoside hydrolase family 27 protein [Streptohalobacillus salinus]PXW92443.1 alpha galactosidase A [Streptohalobacillus salinus]
MRHHQFALTPPMGWNSWDCYGASVTEDEVRANAAYMAEHLKSHGWEYVVVDIQWSEPNADSSKYHPFVPLEMDQYSRLFPATNRFPSAKNHQGFKPLADYIHQLGLKFGIHIMRGIPRQAVHQNTAIKGSEKRARDVALSNSICPWNTDMYGLDPDCPDSQLYYDSLFELYASWGVDFVKVDDIADSKLYQRSHHKEIIMIQRAIKNTHRPIVLSLSPGPSHLEDAALLEDHANMWRMTDDFWDQWHLLKDMFDRCYRWSKNIGPGHWPDADMLPLGHIGIRSVDGGASSRLTRFTKDEQITMMTLWSIFRSPLMFGGELRDNDAFTLKLITDPDLIALNQSGYNQRQVKREADAVVWQSQVCSTCHYVALFNLADTPEVVSISMFELFIDESVSKHIVNCSNNQAVTVTDEHISAHLAPHQSTLFRIDLS